MEVVSLKLSMWILADWLKEYNTRLQIQEGNTTIEGIRFLSGKLKDFSPNHVYIGRAADMFDDGSYRDSIVLAHERDLIFIDGADTDDIINEVLTAIDYYNKWEVQLWEAATHDDGLQRMLDLCDDIFDNPSRIVDMQGLVLAISRKFGPDDYNQRWKKMYETGIVHLSGVSLHVVTVQGEELDEWREVPGIYYVDEDGHRQNYIAAGIWIDEEIVAAILIMEYRTPLSIAHCQLTAVFASILKTSIQNHNRTNLLHSRTSIVQQLLDGEVLSPELISKLTIPEMQAPYCMMVLHCIQSNVPVIRNGSMLTLIRKSPCANVSLIYEDRILTIVSQKNQQRHLEHILHAINAQHYAIGISLPFYSWNDFPAPYKQACFSCEAGRGIAGIYSCKDYAFEYLIGAMRQLNEDYHFQHPAISLLQQYDREHATALEQTLFCYLKCERNIADTCKALYIHRNTLVYRIKRIEELIECDLDNLDERVFLQLSYKINRDW